MTNYSAVNRSCGGLVHVLSARNLTSPNYPMGLPAGFVYCDWTLLGGDNGRTQMVMTFLLVNLPPASTGFGLCSDGFVAYGGFDWRGQRIVHDTICGSGGRNLRPFVAPTNAAWLLMVQYSRKPDAATTEADDEVFYSEHLGFVVELRLLYTQGIIVQVHDPAAV